MILICACAYEFDLIFLGSFGRRASDGGANLQIYYPASGNNGQSVDPVYATPSTSQTQTTRLDNMSFALECGDEANDEIQR